jgi:L-lactate dehydrogenase complex protein LldG
MKSAGEKLAERLQETEARRAIIAAVRGHLVASAPFDAVRNERTAPHEIKTRASHAASHDQAVSLAEHFRQALEAVGGRCAFVRNEEEAAQAVQLIIEQKEAQRIAVSDSPLVQRVIERVESNAVLLKNAAASALFDCDVGITSAQWAVAETGTLVLESDQERHRLLSLVPPVHIAIIEADRILLTLGGVLQAINDKGPNDLSRTVTFVTGPSRTSDIELTLAIGVHGPAEIYVIIIKGEGYE